MVVVGQPPCHDEPEVVEVVVADDAFDDTFDMAFDIAFGWEADDMAAVAADIGAAAARTTRVVSA